MKNNDSSSFSGGCLCGGVRFRIDGDCRDIICCHCENCRRTHGHFAAYTAVQKSALTLVSKDTLRWYHDASPDTWRGFCECCGASLFWDTRDGAQRISISAGSLDNSGGLKTIGHIFMEESANYYQIDDGLPCFQGGSGGALDEK